MELVSQDNFRYHLIMYYLDRFGVTTDDCMGAIDLHDIKMELEELQLAADCS